MIMAVATVSYATGPDRAAHLGRLIVTLPPEAAHCPPQHRTAYAD